MMIEPEDLTDEMLAGYFGAHCECRPLDVDRLSHSHDCDAGPCEDARSALGGLPRDRVTREAKRRICGHIVERGSDPTLLAVLGAQLLYRAARLKAER